MMNSEKTLNTRQRQVLEYLRECIHTCGCPPSVREICTEVGLSSTSTVHKYLRDLEERGFIRRDPAKNRKIELLDEGTWRSKNLFPFPSSARFAQVPQFWRMNMSRMSSPLRRNLSAMMTALCSPSAVTV